MNAEDIATAAAALVAGVRATTYGEKAQNFANIATLWNAYLSIRRDQGAPLTGADAAKMMALLKLARSESGLGTIDNYIDCSGYAAIAGELSGL